MAIYPHHAVFLLKEHQARPIRGNVLTMGRQTITMTMEEAKRVFAEESVSVYPGHFLEEDRDTKHGLPRVTINDRSFFSLFGRCQLQSVDATGYEKADVILDLNQWQSSRVSGIADFIFDGSVLDDVFSPGTAISNMSSMLRPMGRIMHVAAATQIGWGGGFVLLSPEWFYDFYAANNYTDIQVYVCIFADHAGPWAVYEWRPIHNAQMLPLKNCDAMLVVIATKGEKSTNHVMPTRLSYREMYQMPGYSIPTRAHQFSWQVPTFPEVHSPPTKGIIESLLVRCGLQAEGGWIRVKPTSAPPPKDPLPEPQCNPATRCVGMINWSYSDERGWTHEQHKEDSLYLNGYQREVYHKIPNPPHAPDSLVR